MNIGMNTKQQNPVRRSKKSVLASTMQLARSAVSLTVALTFASVTLTALAVAHLADKQRARRIR